MPEYPYRCAECDTRWSVMRSITASSKGTACPECGLKTSQQDYGAKQVVGYINSDDDWCSGKLVPQLHPLHPDRMVTSKKQMEGVYLKHGISLDTGHFVSKEAQVKATVPRNQRLGADLTDLAVGGVIEEN